MPVAKSNPLVHALTQPPIPLVQSWPSEYSGAFGPLLDLSQAVPDFKPHSELLRLLGDCAANPDLFGYGPIQGEQSLRVAYAQFVSESYQADIGAQNTHITAGCNQAFMASMIAIAGKGDKVLMCNPCYFNHETSLAMLGVDVGYIRCEAEHGFLPKPALISELIDDKTRAIVLTSPNNPTGAVYPSDLLLQILELCQARGIWLVIDETYRDFLPTQGQIPHQLFAQQNWSDNLIQLYSFSKSFCIPGHRLGAVCASEQFITEVAKVMDNLQICAPRAAQVAVAKALPLLTEWREQNRVDIELRAHALRTMMHNFPEWKISAMGAYFAFVRHPFEADSVVVAKKLAQERGVTCLPGAFFGKGNDRYLRFAFANVGTEALAALPEKLFELKM